MVDFTDFSGSSTGRSSSSGGYGPQRLSLTKLKVLGGAPAGDPGHLRPAAEAPCSSTSEQLPRETVRYGTSAVTSLAQILIMDDEDVLTFEQRGLFDLCSKDRIRTCQSYGRNPTSQGGQQLLMQNVVQRHLSVQGDGDHNVSNIFIISQCLTTILQNPRNLCYARGAGAGRGLCR